MSNKITDNSKSFFTMIPNIIDDLDLSVYAFRLYVHLKRVTGESGQCWQSTRTIAEKCNMSVGSVSKAKIELVSAGLITVEIKENGHGEFDSHIITINDIWLENIIKYSACSSHEQDRSQNEQDRSPGEPKNNPVKNNQKEEEAPSSFSEMQHTIERLTGYPPNGAAGHKAIGELLAMGANEDDIKNAIAWMQHNGKRVMYYDKLIGPTRTAMAKRRQGESSYEGWTSA